MVRERVRMSVVLSFDFLLVGSFVVVEIGQLDECFSTVGMRAFERFVAGVQSAMLLEVRELSEAAAERVF